uniref:Uncharacterized protein n=1 Tax=Arundo donax TaxID=35708 RepID=A0A0A9AM73_ARUDO
MVSISLYRSNHVDVPSKALD